MQFDNEKLKAVAEKHFGGIQKFHAFLAQAGILVNVATLNKWCYTGTTPNLKHWVEVHNFIIGKVPSLKEENFMKED